MFVVRLAIPLNYTEARGDAQHPGELEGEQASAAAPPGRQVDPAREREYDEFIL